LFPQEKRRITPDDVVEAISRDQADLEQLRVEVQKFKDELTSPSGPDRLTARDINKFCTRAEELLLRTAQIGDIANDFRKFLRDLRDNVLVKCLRDSCPPEVKKQLEAGLAETEGYQQTWSNQFLAQFMRKDSPITEGDLLPSLLLEDVNTVRIVAGVLADQNLRGLGEAAVALIENAKKEGYIVPDAAEKIRALS